MLNISHTRLLMLSLLCFGLSTGGCGGSGGSSDSEKKITEHHDSDHATPHSNGNTNVNLGNTPFTTSQYKFSDDGNGAATGLSLSADQTYSIGQNIKRFGIDGNSIHAYIKDGAFDSHLISYNLSTQTETASVKADFSITGFSFNGVVLTSDGNEDINFYTVKDEKITDSFFHIKGFNNSKFNGEVFLDHNKAYVSDNGGDIMSFPIHETGDIKKVMTTSAFSTISFAADGLYVYVVSGESPNKTNVYRINKSNQSHELWFSETSIAANSIAVDSNHIYVAGYDSNSAHSAAIIKVYKKSDHSHLTDLNAPYVEDIKIHNGKVYDFNSNTKILTVRTLNFTP